MQGFNGFPDGALPTLPLPRQFFSDVMPYIDHLGEMKVTLYVFWAMYAQEGRYRYVKLSEILADNHFMRGMPAHLQGPEAAVRDGLERAIARGTLLYLDIQINDQPETIYFVNGEKGRRALADLRGGIWQPETAHRPLSMVGERPNLFRLYEQNIGMLSPMIADQLQDLERDYSAEWLADAIRVAAHNNKRSLNYIIALLKSWHAKGRDKNTQAQPQPNPDELKARYAHMLAARRTDETDGPET
ncbi:MAG: DnaD domain-containing protein [Anaerolineales bacterium]